MFLHQAFPQSHRAIDHAIKLMAVPSITPEDNGCQDYLVQKLSALGFSCQMFSIQGVRNLISRWGHGDHHYGMCGHTDVVPPGPLERWTTPPFEPDTRNGYLYGRGAADMKTGLAAMLGACERALPLCDPRSFSLWWCVTSDEEGEAEHGSKWIVEYLKSQHIELDSVVIAEPTAKHRTGDVIKVGRRGSLSAKVLIKGKQGHVAYPHAARNALHDAARLIDALNDANWDVGSEDFPGTSFQATGIDSGMFTDNLVPGQCTVNFNIRYSDSFSESTLKCKVLNIIRHTIDEHFDECDIAWERPCQAYLSQPKALPNCLIKQVETAINETTGQYPLLSTSGGTSDGRFFGTEQTQVVEVGVPNKSIHQIDEHVHLSDIATLEDTFTHLLKQWSAT